MEYVAKMDSGPITEKQLVDAEFSAAKLKEIGYGAEQLKLCGFDAKELKEAEFTAIQLRCAGFTPAEMRAGGYTINEVFDAGFKHSRLVEAGFTANEMREEMNLNLVELRAAGFKAGQLKAVGFLASELRAVGATAAEIKPYFTPGGLCCVIGTRLPHTSPDLTIHVLFHRDPARGLPQGEAQTSGRVAPRRAVAALQQLLVVLLQPGETVHLLRRHPAHRHRDLHP